MAASLIIFARSDPTAPAVARAISLKLTVSSRLTFFACTLQNIFSSFEIRAVYDHSAVKTSRTQKCQSPEPPDGSLPARIMHTFGGIKTIHLRKQLVQCLFTLVVSAAITAVTALTDRIDLIDKNNTRCTLFGPLQTGLAHAMHRHRQTFPRNRNRKWRRTARVPLLRLPLPAMSYRYPDGPTSSAPFGSFAPIFTYFCGSSRNPTTS